MPVFVEIARHACAPPSTGHIRVHVRDKHRRQEVLLLQVLDSDERTFPFREMGMFENLENPADQLKLDPVLIRAGYLKALEEHLPMPRRPLPP